MNTLKIRRLLLASTVILNFLLAPLTAGAEVDVEDGKTLSPYFFVQSDDPDTDRLPLKSTDVNVKITGVIADVTVAQHYRNEGKRPLEARYVFPASSHAAVYAMQMHVGKRVLEAKIRGKQQARAEYEAAKSAGKSASLLEQERPNVFQMNVANVLPGDDIAVVLHYTETIVPTEGTYQFVYPAVVGPRYNGPAGSGSGVKGQWVQTPYLPSAVAPTSTFAIKVDLVSPIPLQTIASSTHDVDIKKPGRRHAVLDLPASTRNGNRDFMLDYRLAGKTIQTGTLLYRGEDESFFMTMIEPPARVTADAVVPREYVFIVDVSGSMNGFPLATAKTLLRNLVGNLRPIDTFNVMLFSGNNRVLAPQSLPANQANIDQAMAVINQQSGGGGTELLPALRTALAMDKADQRSRNFVVITDGYVTVEKEAFDLIRNNLNKANVFAFGIGSSVNRFLMEGLAHAGQGEAFIVTNGEEAKTAAATFKRYIESPVWTHLGLDIQGLDAYDVLPARLPDLFARRPLVIIGKWRGSEEGEISVSGITSMGKIRQTVTVGDGIISENAVALRYLWARGRIAELGDYSKLMGGVDDDAIRQITGLGLKYNLLTDYTAFIAIDATVRTRREGGTVDQPSPLPQGVSELAVGAEVPSTPEPEFYAMMAMAAGVGAWLRHRGKAHGC